VRSDRVRPEIWACKGSGRVPCLHEEIEGGSGESGRGESGRGESDGGEGGGSGGCERDGR
jgi:hypothetical protein